MCWWPCILVWSLQITDLTNSFSCMFISILYMFRAAVCPSSGELLNKRPTWCHLLFYFTSYMLNMFRTLILPSSGTCDFAIVSPHWSCVLVSMCVGVSVWLGWGGSRVAGWSFSLLHGYHPNPATPKPQHTSNQEQHDQCGNSTE